MLSRFSCNVFPYKNLCRIPTITSTVNAFWFVIHCYQYHMWWMHSSKTNLLFSSEIYFHLQKFNFTKQLLCTWIDQLLLLNISIHSSIQLSCLMYVFTLKTKTLNQNNTNTDQSKSPHAHLLTTTHNTQHFSLINFICFVLFVSYICERFVYCFKIRQSELWPNRACFHTFTHLFDTHHIHTHMHTHFFIICSNVRFVRSIESILITFYEKLEISWFFKSAFETKIVKLLYLINVFI